MAWRQNGAVLKFGWDSLNRGPVSQQARHYKDPSCSKVVDALQTLDLTVQPFVIIDNVQIRVKYSQTDLKQYTMNESINLSTSLLYCTIYMFWSMGAQYLSISIRYFAKKLHEYKKKSTFFGHQYKA